MDVRDADGRLWTIRERVLPWHAWLLNKVLRRDGELVPAPKKGYEEKPLNRSQWLEMLIAFLLQPHLWILAILLSPFLVLEALAQLVGAGILGVGRQLGMARRRVEVVGHTGSLLHSRTVLLTRGSAAGLIADIGTERASSARTFHPSALGSVLGPDVEVKSHRSVWQASSEWVG